MCLISPFHIRLNSVVCLTKISKKMAKILPGSLNQWTMDLGSETVFRPFSWDLNHSIKRKSLSYKTLKHGQSGELLRSAPSRHVLSESTSKYKGPRAWIGTYLVAGTIPRQIGWATKDKKPAKIYRWVFLWGVGEYACRRPTKSCPKMFCIL